MVSRRHFTALTHFSETALPNAASLSATWSLKNDESKGGVLRSRNIVSNWISELRTANAGDVSVHYDTVNSVTLISLKSKSLKFDLYNRVIRTES